MMNSIFFNIFPPFSFPERFRSSSANNEGTLNSSSELWKLFKFHVKFAAFAKKQNRLIQEFDAVRMFTLRKDRKLSAVRSRLYF